MWFLSPGFWRVQKADALLGGNVWGPVPGQCVSPALSIGWLLEPSLCAKRQFDLRSFPQVAR